MMIPIRSTPSESRAVTTPERQLDEVLARLPIGAILENKYRLDRVLGAGSMGTVFAATHLRNGNRVAVKVLHCALGALSHVRSRFLLEGYATNCVRHTGTVRVLDDGIAANGALFLVMELLEGETVQALWERGGRLPPRQVAKLMWQVLDVLSAAHEGGIVHRDVKPENLFVERDGTLRVLDFGVARVLWGTLAESRAGGVIGTLPYMSPEQMLGRTHEVDARSDVWSVGATAFTLIAGSFVHDAETPEEMLVFTASRQALSLAQAAPRAPRALVDVVDRALRFDRSERWPSARAMQAGLAEACRLSETTEEPVEDESGDRATPELETPREGPRVAPPQVRHAQALRISPFAASIVRSRRGVASATRRAARWVPAAAVVVAVAVAAVAALTAYGSGARSVPTVPTRTTSANR